MNFSEKICHFYQLPGERKLWMLVFFIGSLLSWFAIRISSSQTLARKMGDQYLQNRTLCVLAS